MYFRFTFEMAGNSLRLVDKLTNRDYNDTTTYEILGIDYSQYFRPEMDARYYQIFNENSSMVYRVTGGIGIAYLNSVNIPYEKTFFTGGVNDLRAYRARTVGPGSYEPENYIEQLGDIKINANIEYRFDIFKILEGAFFVDAGNVWLLKDNPSQPGGKFEAADFLGQFAIGSGFGLRLDFKFFIFRVDVGVPLKDPGRPEGNRWVVETLKLDSSVLNFGIGYPF
jgi:outer membrane protein assembly factor BamA